MIEEKTLHLQIESNGKTAPIDFTVKRLLLAGFSGRSQDKVMAHVRELAAVGHPAPDKTPIFFNVSPYLASTTTGVTVIDRLSSGEVEYVLFFKDGETYVTCGSDHTNREMEKYSIPAGKQMHTKVFPPALWKLSDVADHWDQLTLKSWSTLAGKRRLYQEGTFGDIMTPDALMAEGAPRFGEIRQDGTIFMSGTLSAIGGLEFGDRFEYQLHDPVLNRTIEHAYDVSILA